MVSLFGPSSMSKIPNMGLGDASVYQGTGMGPTRADQLFSQANLKMSHHRFEKFSVHVPTGNTFVPKRGKYRGTVYPIMVGQYANGTMGKPYYVTGGDRKVSVAARERLARALNVSKYALTGDTNAIGRTVYVGPRGGLFVLSKSGRRAKPSVPRKQRVVQAASPYYGLFD